MIKTILSISVITLITSASLVYAQCSTIEDDKKRLECYDAAVDSSSAPCEIEDFNLMELGSGLKITGAMTCSDGRMNYRLYDGDENFLTAGFTYFEGYSLIIMERVPAPNRINIRYSVEKR